MDLNELVAKAMEQESFGGVVFRHMADDTQFDFCFDLNDCALNLIEYVQDIPEPAFLTRSKDQSHWIAEVFLDTPEQKKELLSILQENNIKALGE